MDFHRQFAGEQAAAPGVEVKDWHFDILQVGTDATKEDIMRSYRSKIRGLHPDRRNSIPELLRWAQMLNDAKEALCDEEAREVDRRRRMRFDFSFNLLCEGDIVNLVAMKDPRYGRMHGRVQGLEHGKVLVQTQLVPAQWSAHARAKAAKQPMPISVAAYKCRRLYGERERDENHAKWSEYFEPGSLVKISNVDEAPWYNGLEAQVVEYDRDLMRFNVKLTQYGSGSEHVALQPHNIRLVGLDMQTCAQPSQQQVEARVKDAEQAKCAAEKRAEHAEQAKCVAEKRAQDAEQAKCAAEKRAGHAEQAKCVAEKRTQEAEQKSSDLELAAKRQKHNMPTSNRNSLFDPRVGDTVEVRVCIKRDGVTKTSWPGGVIMHIEESGMDVLYHVKLRRGDEKVCLRRDIRPNRNDKENDPAHG